MPHYEFPFSKTLTPTEYRQAKVVCPQCGGGEVEQRWFYSVAIKKVA